MDDITLIVILAFVVFIALIAVGYGIRHANKVDHGYEYNTYNHLTHKSDSDDTLFIK